MEFIYFIALRMFFFLYFIHINQNISLSSNISVNLHNIFFS